MSDRALLNAILADPDADAPRLVYADWLQENGDPDRAEFIRVQCELARLPDADPTRTGLEDREHELLEANELRWVDLEADELREWEFRRGFIESMTASPWVVGPATFRAHPVQIWAVVPDEFADIDDPEAIAAYQHFNGIEHLDLSGWPTLIGHTDVILASGRFERLSGLDLSRRPQIARLARVLIETPARNRLRSLAFGGRTGPNFQWADAANETLDVPDFVAALADAPLEDLTAFDCGLTSDGLRALLRAPFAGRLRRLDVSDNPLAPDGYRAFQLADRDTRLTRLDVSGTPLAGISLEPVLASRACEGLTELEMNRCGSARRNMEVVAGSAFWTRATAFRAHGGTIPASTLEPLCGSTGPPALRLLDLADNYLRADGVRLLCDAPWAGSLTWLALSGNLLDDDAVAAICESGRFTHLRTLHLAHNAADAAGEVTGITDRSALLLANTPSLANLRILSLRDTHVTDAAVGPLLNGPHWRLSGLGLSQCDLSAAAVRELAASPRLGRLTWLDLSVNPRLSGDALLPLAESPYLSRLCELDVGGVYVSERTTAALRARLGPRLST